MDDLLSKISSYNLFNNLFPGIVLLEVARALSLVILPDLGILELLFIYYFVGMVVSRIGSLLLEPMLKLLKVIPNHEYEKFLAAEKDSKLDLLLEQSNVYRTLAALFLLLGVWLLVVWLGSVTGLHFGRNVKVTLGILGLFALFASSFKKQTNFIVRRVENHHVNR